MTDLRERVARAIYYAGQNPNCFHENRKWENLAPGLQDSYRDTAEAVVDELGFTKEVQVPHTEYADGYPNPHSPRKIFHRYITPWEAT